MAIEHHFIVKKVRLGNRKPGINELKATYENRSLSNFCTSTYQLVFELEDVSCCQARNIVLSEKTKGSLTLLFFIASVRNFKNLVHLSSF